MDANGQAVFTLPAGNYRFRSDLNGTQFWSATTNDCSVPGCSSAVVTTTVPLTVTVVDTNGTTAAGLPFYTHFPLLQCQVEQEFTTGSENSTTKKKRRRPTALPKALQSEYT